MEGGSGSGDVYSYGNSHCDTSDYYMDYTNGPGVETVNYLDVEIYVDGVLSTAPTNCRTAEHADGFTFKTFSPDWSFFHSGCTSADDCLPQVAPDLGSETSYLSMFSDRHFGCDSITGTVATTCATENLPV